MTATRTDVRNGVCALVNSGRAKELREQAGITMREAAHRLDVEIATLWRWETGRHVPVGKNLRAYGRFLARLEGSAATPSA